MDAQPLLSQLDGATDVERDQRYWVHFGDKTVEVFIEQWDQEFHVIARATWNDDLAREGGPDADIARAVSSVDWTAFRAT